MNVSGAKMQGSPGRMSPSRSGRPRDGGDVVESPEETFIQIVSRLDYPMVVVTARSDDGPAGCLVGFVTQCSIHPPRYLVCLSDVNRTERIAARADVLAVHFLAAREVALARMFGEDTTDETDTFSRFRWHPGPGGAPILDDCGRWLVGTIFERRPLGDHVAYVLDPVAAQCSDPTPGLMFQEVDDLEPGHPA
jgi:flavin reductase (DIM6/NTAB) family NADH-FMN oxidoreductase RutF